MGTTIPSPPAESPSRDPEAKPLPEPEEEELNGKQMSFLEHLEELRMRLLRSIYALLVGAAVCFYFHEQIYHYLAKPLTDTLQAAGMPPKLAYTNPVDPFNLYIKLSIVCGIFLASPYILLQLWLFVSPGLYRHEKKYVWPFVLLTSGLFICGGFFAYKLAFPKALAFLISFGHDFQPVVTVHEYWDLATDIMLAVGLAFELPVVILLLSLFGLITPKFLLKHFRYAILITAILAAAIVPTNDLASVFVVWIPLVGLYLLSIGLSWLVTFKKKRAAQRAALASRS
jgi:sec-independent protein translocase protein TatC